MDAEQSEPKQHGVVHPSVTTERLTIADYRSSPGDYAIYSLHVATYEFAMKFVAGMTVLDFGCGTGYGTARLAESAATVTGVDVSEAAIAAARQGPGAANLEFRRIDLVQKRDLPFADDSFDVVVSFQVIEHIEDVSRYVGEVRRVLKQGGTFLCVTPDRAHRLFPRQRPWNEFHFTEFTPEELSSILRSRFTEVTINGMTARQDIIGYELRRYRRMRLLAYPFTFPRAPEVWRRWGIRTAKRLIAARASKPVSRTFDFGPDDIEIGPTVQPSVNIVAVAKGGDPQVVRA